MHLRGFHKPHYIGMESSVKTPHIVEDVLLVKGRTKDTSHVGTWFRGYQKTYLYSNLILQVQPLL